MGSTPENEKWYLEYQVGSTLYCLLVFLLPKL